MTKSAPIAHAKTVQRIRQLSHLLDNAIPIPGTRYRIGIDPILGLLPGGGDIASGLLSTYIIYSAAKLGVPQETLLKMVSNILLDTIAGTIPVVGDIADVAWKANLKNLEILETHLQLPPSSTKANPWIVFLLLAGLVLAIILVASFSIFLITSLFRLITGT
ncbi:MAG TPA: DUF4112 domain-containing protein [Halomicronema sp.]